MGWCMQDKRCKEKVGNIDIWTHWMQESTIVLNVNKHSNYAAAAKFKLKEETFAEEFIK